MAGRQIVVEIVGDNKKFGTAVDGAVSKSSSLSSKLGGIGKGMTIGAGIGVFNLLSDAVGGVTDKLGEAADAFNEDQAGAKILNTALKNNIPGWDGNTDGINKYIDAQGRLGFADDDVRAGMAQTIGVTHDARKSMELNSLAQDIARAKGISLAEATDVVTKAYNGNGKGLKSLGIDIAGAKTGTDMLADAQKNVKGASEDWATTNDGKLAASNVKVGESMEKIGGIVNQVSSVVMPALADAFSAVTDFITSNMPTIQPIVEGVMGGIRTAIEWVTVNVLPKLGEAFNWIVVNVIPPLKEQFDFLAANVFPLIGKAIDWIATNVIPALGAAFKWFLDNVLPAVRSALRFIIDNVIPALGKAFDWIAKNVIPPLGSAFSWIVNNVLPPLKSAIGFVTNTVLPALGKAFGFVTDTVLPAIGGGINTAVGIFKSISTTVGKVKDDVTNAFNGIVDFIVRLPGRMAGALGDLFTPLWSGFKGAINSVIRGWNGLRFSLPGFDFGPVHVSGISIGTPNIPYLHAGGIVPGAPGSDVLTMLQAGERVLPRSAVSSSGHGTGGGGFTIIVNGDVYGDGIDALADKLALRLRLAGA